MKKVERQLLELNRALNAEGQEKLRSYAEFLSTQATNVSPVDTSKQQPKPISAAENESVVGAIKRLSESYFMLNRAKLLDSASILMAQHVMQGRGAGEVIEELETKFSNAYQQYCDDIEKKVSADTNA